MRVAVVDIGTNTVRLLVADVSGSAAEPEVEIVERGYSMTRLGRGVDAVGRLDPAAVAATLGALESYATTAGRLDVARSAAVATSATRDASDGDAFLDAAAVALGVRPRVITGDEEAVLSYTGAMLGLDRPAPVLVVDLGGGSTEFVLGDRRPTYVASIDIGSVRLTERALPAAPVSATELATARSLATSLLGAVRLPSSPATIVGVGGTFTTLASLILDVHESDVAEIGGVAIAAEKFHALVPRLAGATTDQIASLPAVPEGRAPVLVGGAIVASAALTMLRAGEVVISVAGILDGLALETGLTR